jgi:hypothetical protein
LARGAANVMLDGPVLRRLADPLATGYAWPAQQSAIHALSSYTTDIAAPSCTSSLILGSRRTHCPSS